MKRTCIIIEDQPPAQRILQKYIADIGSLELKSTFSDAIEALQYLQENDINLIFLDIHLPKISGIDFLNSLKHQPQVILTTAFSEYALKSYEYNVVDYLLKPFSFQRFVQAVTKSSNNIVSKTLANNSDEHQTAETSFFIKSGYDHIQIEISDILCIKSEADYTEIITSKKKHLTSFSLKYWLEKLDRTRFAQVHKSFIVNTNLVNKVSGNQIFFKNSTHIVPIGRTYKEAFTKMYLK
ncbi:LytR/AlgR family response regulator transcription factor [Pontimicrobium sp. IMCC45349]|uniref:LytR/AlgR family response regulator transcription factor n=1 Tax=Pontimicrobium sp. IMCC45349 TaxID=3391574 RepID=UPI0039A3C0B4